MKQASFGIYRSGKPGSFLLSWQFEDEQGLHCDSGSFVRLDDAEMRAKGSEFAEQHFRSFQMQKYHETSELQSMSAEEQKEFFLSHDHVWVYWPSETEVVFWPSQIVRRQGKLMPVGLGPEDTVHLAWPSTPDAFFGALMEAFQKVP